METISTETFQKWSSLPKKRVELVPKFFLFSEPNFVMQRFYEIYSNIVIRSV
jgi:hypothetical protein